MTRDGLSDILPTNQKGECGTSTHKVTLPYQSMSTTKTAVCADLHLNNSNFGRIDKNGLSFRTKDFMAAFEFFVDQCINVIKPDRVVILGDVYENPHPQNPVRRFFNRMLKRLSKAGIKVELKVGNHDSCYFSHALQPIEEAGFNGVRVHYTANLIVEDDCAMVFLPHTQEIERRETTHKMLVREFSATHAVDIAKAKSEGLPVLAFGHFGIRGVEMNDGILNHNKEDVSLDDLGDIGADAFFMGHYHMAQELAIPGTTRAMYVGSLERSTFNDKSLMKSFAVVTTERGQKPVVERIEYTGARPMVTVTGNTQEILDEVNRLKVALPAGSVEPIVKFQFVGTQEEYAGFCRVKKTIRDDLSGAKHVAFEKDVHDPTAEAKADAVRQSISSKADVGGADVLEIFDAYLEAAVANPDARGSVARLAAEIVKTVNDKDKADRGIVPGRTRIHGVKLHNFQMYGTDRNVVELDPGCGTFMGRSWSKEQDWSNVRDEASSFLETLSDDDRKLISIIGKIDGDESESNGSGKSSILDGISWAFYEKIVRDFFDKESSKGSSTTSVVRTVDDKHARECFVEVLFSAGKSLYLIRRERRFTSSDKHSGNCFLWCLYSPDAMSDAGSMAGRRGEDAEQFVNQLVSMDFDTFSNSVMFGQSDADKFIRGTDKAKKEIFVKILGLTILDEYLKESRTRKSLIDKELASLESQVMALSSNAMTDEEVANAETRASVLAEEVKDEDNKVVEFAKAIKVLREDPVFARERQLESEVAKYRALIVQRQEEAKRSCKSSSDALSAEQANLVQYRRDEESSSRSIKDTESEISRLEAKLVAFDEQALTKEVNLGEQARAAKPKRQAEREELLAKRDVIQIESATASSNIASIGKAMQKIANALSNMGDKQEFTCPECESPVTRQHLEEKYTRLSEEYAAAKEAKHKAEAPSGEIQKAIAEVNQRLANIDEYSSKGFAAASKIDEHKSVAASLDAARIRISDIKTRKASASDRVVASEKAVAAFRSAVDAAVADAAKDNAEFESKVAVATKEINEVVTPAKRNIERRVLDYEQSSANSVRMAKAKESERSGILARVEVSRKTSEKVAKAKADKSAKEAEQIMLCVVESGFGLDGIRVQIIEKYIPLLNVYVGEFMDVISDKMSVTVITDGKRDGKMEIKVKGSSASDPRQLSKGQFAKLKVAMDLSLGMMSLARNENAPDFVCLDEVFAPVDVSGKRAMFDVIAKLQEYFRMVLVISHDPMIQETVKDTIVVNMINDVSTIEKQAHEH